MTSPPPTPPDLTYVMEGSRPELARFIDALWRAGIATHVRAKDDCEPTS